MKSENNNHKKQKIHTILAAIIGILFTAPYIIVPIYVYILIPDISVWILSISLIYTAVVIGILFALRERIKEINKGELDDASKY